MEQDTLDIKVERISVEQLEDQKLAKLDKEALKQFAEDLLERRRQAIIELEESERLINKVGRLLYE